MNSIVCMSHEDFYTLGKGFHMGELINLTLFCNKFTIILVVQ